MPSSCIILHFHQSLASLSSQSVLTKYIYCTKVLSQYWSDQFSSIDCLLRAGLYQGQSILTETASCVLYDAHTIAYVLCISNIAWNIIARHTIAHHTISYILLHDAHCTLLHGILLHGTNTIVQRTHYCTTRTLLHGILLHDILLYNAHTIARRILLHGTHIIALDSTAQ